MRNSKVSKTHIAQDYSLPDVIQKASIGEDGQAQPSGQSGGFKTQQASSIATEESLFVTDSTQKEAQGNTQTQQQSAASTFAQPQNQQQMGQQNPMAGAEDPDKHFNNEIENLEVIEHHYILDGVEERLMAKLGTGST